MLFKPELAQKVLKGEKTQTRRTRKPGEWFYKRDDGEKVVFAGTRIKWMTGKTYAVQTGRGKPGIGYFRLLDICEQNLQEIDNHDAWREGIPKFGNWIKNEGEARDEYLRLWDSINKAPGLRSEDNPQVWVLTFEAAT